jgi:mannosyltransferase OCH1-like enzyme
MTKAFQSNNNDPRWELLQELWEKNYVEMSRPIVPLAPRIPYKIHQIWLGSPFPAKYQGWADTWKRLNLGWEYKLWTDKDIDDVAIPNRTLFNSITHVAQHSDFLRYHILNQYGGLYVDTDFECLRPVTPLNVYEFYTSAAYGENVELYIGLIASTPGHPIIRRVIEELDAIRSKTWKEVFNTTGTYFFTRVFFEEMKEYRKGVVVFPTKYFYPFPNYVRRECNAREFIRPCSYAIHHWEVSWAKHKKR